MKKEILKKGQDILQVMDSSGEYPVLLKYRSKHAKAIVDALERVVGSPALDDYADGDNESPTVKISRYRLKEDIELGDE